VVRSVTVYGAGSCRVRCASRTVLRFHGSSASIASTVVPGGNEWNSAKDFL
jgi:hypothetical protein